MTLVDFSVTFAGLEDQLLGKLILKVASRPLSKSLQFHMVNGQPCLYGGLLRPIKERSRVSEMRTLKVLNGNMELELC